MAQEQYPHSQAGTVSEQVPIPAVSDEIWKLILDRSQIPETMIHMLKGEVWVTSQDKDGNVSARWEPRGLPLMNETGIRFFSSFLYSSMSPDKLATRLTELEVNQRAHDMTKALILIVAERGNKFGIDPSNRTYIVRILDDFYFSNLTASRKGTILDALKPAYERIEHYSPAKQSSSFLPGIRLPGA